MSDYLKDKVAIVTGAGQGVGQGIALALASEGVHIAVLGRTLDKLESTCEQIRERGVRAVPFEANVTDLDAVPGVVDAVVAEFGKLDILVNNAYDGVFGKNLLDTSAEEFERGFRAGPFASFAFMKAAHPHLVAAGGGDIVNLVSSAMVRWDPKTFGPYAAAKQALRALTRAAAAEWAMDGIRANNIAPHAMSPGLEWWTQTFPDEAAEFVSTIPMKRIGDCEADIGRAVVALVGPDLRYLTGATLPLDGGQAYFG